MRQSVKGKLESPSWNSVLPMSQSSFFKSLLRFHVASSYSFFFFSFLATPWHTELPGQGSVLSCSCNLYHICGNSRSFNPQCRVGDKTRILGVAELLPIPLCHRDFLHVASLFFTPRGSQSRTVPSSLQREKRRLA